MNGILQHFRYALRQLRKSPGFTTVAVVTLALGIGATTAIYTVLYATVLAPMPYPNPEQLVMVWSKLNGERNVVSAADFLDWKRQNTVFQDLNAWNDGMFNLATANRPEHVAGQLTTPGWYGMQGFRFFIGRDFVPEEGEPWPWRQADRGTGSSNGFQTGATRSQLSFINRTWSHETGSVHGTSPG